MMDRGRTNRLDAVRWATEGTWLIRPTAFQRLLTNVETREHGEYEEPQELPSDSSGAVKVLPIQGIMLPHFGRYSTGEIETYTEAWGEMYRAAMLDPEVSGVVVPIDSPGGLAFGTQELADLIFSLRDEKPNVAIASPMAASAAFWVGTAFDEFVVQPSGMVGSHGVFVTHVDMSAALEEMGVDVELIHYGQYKVEGNPFEPLSEEAREEFQRSVNMTGEAFTAALARNRGVSEETVLETFGQGRMIEAGDALERGIVDGIETFAEVMARLGGDADDVEIPDEEPGEDEGVRGADVAPGLEIREMDAEVRAEGEGTNGVLRGDAVPYGSEADLVEFTEEFAPGALDESVLHDDLRVLWQHDRRYVFGRTKSGTARFWTENDVVKYQATPPDAQWARDAMQSVKRGDVDKSSFGFKVLPGGQKWERRGDRLHRTVTKAKLVEAGPQTFAAYGATDTSVAQRHMAAFEQNEAELDLLRRKTVAVSL